MPVFLAGREEEKKEFQRLLEQTLILENLVLTGLRGLGKTVLLETFKPMAVHAGWLWAGTDLSESASITEENLAIRILADISVVTSSIQTGVEYHNSIGLAASIETVERHLDFQALMQIYAETPGLISDKLKQVLETVWKYLSASGKRGIVFAYDEAQNLADHKAKDQFPLSLLLDVFQSIQKKDIPFMLALTGLPTLLPKLVHARTFAERMFRVVSLDPLSKEETVLAISVPTKGHRIRFSQEAMNRVWEVTAGYPYFIQYICRETYDVWLQALSEGGTPGVMPIESILRKLDTDFFAGRWARATDRQRQLLTIVAELPNCDREFTVQEIVEHEDNQDQEKPFTGSHVNQMLVTLTDAGLTYKNRHGKYSFAVPLMGNFIRRQSSSQHLVLD
jgi:uncharacterized glyoxalase superfamily protein PhnB